MTKIVKPPHTKVSLTWSKLNGQTVIADAVAESVCGKNLNTFDLALKLTILLLNAFHKQDIVD